MAFTDWLLGLLHTLYNVETSKPTATVTTTYQQPTAAKRAYKPRKRKTAAEVVDAIVVK